MMLDRVSGEMTVVALDSRRLDSFMTPSKKRDSTICAQMPDVSIVKKNVIFWHNRRGPEPGGQSTNLWIPGIQDECCAEVKDNPAEKCPYLVLILNVKSNYLM